VRRQVLTRFLVRNVVDALCAGGALGAPRAAPPLPQHAVLRGARDFAPDAAVAAALERFRDVYGAAVEEAQLRTAYAQCSWRRVALRPGAWVELGDGAVRHVRGMFAVASVSGGALLLLEDPVPLRPVQVLGDLHRIHPGLQSWAEVARLLEDRGFQVLRNRWAAGGDGAVDRTAAFLVFLPIAQVRALGVSNLIIRWSRISGGSPRLIFWALRLQGEEGILAPQS